MIKPSTKIKRGTLFVIKDTGEEVKHSIITHDGLHMVTYANGSWATFPGEDLQPVQKKPTPINKVSENKKGDDKVYATLRKVFLENHTKCEITLHGCTQQSTEVHHLYSGGSRSKYYLDVREWLASCRHCHHVVHNVLSKDDAINMGYKKIE